MTDRATTPQQTARGAARERDQAAGRTEEQAPPAPVADTGTKRRPESVPLLAAPEADAVTQRWRDIQAAFVDSPQRAVQDADALISDLTKRLGQLLDAERSSLEAQWNRGEQVTTEDLRVSLQRYRSFFHRLLGLRY